MKFYLRIINPVIALTVFVLCFWAATASEESFNIFGIIIGGMPTYFFAKGLFTSASLLILGRILLEMLYHSENTPNKKYRRSETLYSISFGFLTIGSLISLFLLGDFDKFYEKRKTLEPISTPSALKIDDVHRISESDRLKYSGRISNNSEDEWKTIKIEGKLFINGKLSEQEDVTIASLGSKNDESFIMDFDDFCNRNVPDSARIEFEIKATENKSK